MKKDFTTELSKGGFKTMQLPCNYMVSFNEKNNKINILGVQKMAKINEITDIKVLKEMLKNSKVDLNLANDKGDYKTIQACMDNQKEIRTQILSLEQVDTFGQITAILESFAKIPFSFKEKYINESQKTNYREMTSAKENGVTIALKMTRNVSLSK